MKIPDNLSRWSNATLVIAAGILDARIYVVQNGAVAEHHEVRKEKPAYSDREGLFVRKGKGKVLGAGAVREDRQEEKTHKEFLDDLGHRLAELIGKHSVEKVLLFAPQQGFEEMADAVPAVLRPRIAYMAPGNFSKRRVLDLLQMADDALNDKNARQRRSIAKDEAQKILGRLGRPRGA